jgi:hypothetical protein
LEKVQPSAVEEALEQTAIATFQKGHHKRRAPYAQLAFRYGEGLGRSEALPAGSDEQPRESKRRARPSQALILRLVPNGVNACRPSLSHLSKRQDRELRSPSGNAYPIPSLMRAMFELHPELAQIENSITEIQMLVSW